VGATLPTHLCAFRDEFFTLTSISQKKMTKYKKVYSDHQYFFIPFEFGIFVFLALQTKLKQNYNIIMWVPHCQHICVPFAINFSLQTAFPKKNDQI
jgi:hypothetical protein